VVLGLGAVGAGVYLLTKGDDPKADAALADLVPVPNAGGAVCAFDGQQRPTVRVANNGPGSAAASSTRLASPRGGTAILPTPALAAGETTVLAVSTRTDRWRKRPRTTTRSSRPARSAAPASRSRPCVLQCRA
jgi:hypothetical protein